MAVDPPLFCFIIIYYFVSDFNKSITNLPTRQRTNLPTYQPTNQRTYQPTDKRDGRILGTIHFIQNLFMRKKNIRFLTPKSKLGIPSPPALILDTKVLRLVLLYWQQSGEQI